MEDTKLLIECWEETLKRFFNRKFNVGFIDNGFIGDITYWKVTTNWGHMEFRSDYLDQNKVIKTFTAMHTQEVKKR